MRVMGPGSCAVRALGVLAVGELDAAEHLAGEDAHRLDEGAAQLDVERLSADGVAAAGHDVRGGDAASQSHFDAGVIRIDGVDGAETWLNGAGHFVAVRAGPVAGRPKMPIWEWVSTSPG